MPGVRGTLSPITLMNRCFEPEAGSSLWAVVRLLAEFSGEAEQKFSQAVLQRAASFTSIDIITRSHPNRTDRSALAHSRLLKEPR
jgi:hypothetical protein